MVKNGYSIYLQNVSETLTSHHNSEDGKLQVLKKWGVGVATKFVWLRRGTSDGLL
jgi:hypothetical protein